MPIHHLKKHLKKFNIHTEHIKIFILLGLLTLILIIIGVNNFLDKIYLDQPTEIGLSYSPSHAENLGLNPKTVYQDILEDLKVKNLRLAVYWNEIEKKPGKFDFSETDYYLKEAEKHQIKVILSIGYKLPRWPECRAPEWLDEKNIFLRQERQLFMLEKVINHFDENPAVVAWQVENEPLLLFGTCPSPDENFLKKEVEFIRSKTKKPIILTDSGELQSWIVPMQLSDYFGTTLYRTVQSPILGEITYPAKPWIYRIKSALVRKLFAPGNQKTIITELQAEPWADKFIAEVPIKEQLKGFPPEKLKSNVEFAKKVGFDSIYLWGVEWWYFMKVQGYPKYWEEAVKIFNLY